MFTPIFTQTMQVGEEMSSLVSKKKDSESSATIIIPLTKCVFCLSEGLPIVPLAIPKCLNSSDPREQKLMM